MHLIVLLCMMCEDHVKKTHLKSVFLNMSLTQEDEEAASVFKQEYVQEWWPSTKTVLQRQATLVLRNKSFVYARIVQVIEDSSSRSFSNIQSYHINCSIVTLILSKILA
jgi:hypothetical protein